MLQVSNSIILNKSIFRRINPTFKFVIFILLIFLIFIPAGFFGQLIVGTFIIGCLILAKLSKKITFNLIKTFVIMLVLFLIINWITIKSPMGVYLGGDDYNFLGKIDPQATILWPGSSHGYVTEGIYISKMFGGTMIGIVPQEHVDYFVNDNYAAVTKWIARLDANSLAEARIKLSSFLGVEVSENYANAILYLLNNPYSVNGVDFKLLQLTNLSPNWLINNLLCNPQGAVIYQSTWYSMGPLAIFKAFEVSIKVMLIIITSTILTTTTTPSELTTGIEKIFAPLKIIHFPANECALILSIGIRFIPSLLSESKRILNAQAARGLDYYNGSLIDKIRALISLIIPLFSISIRKSDDLANAMDARGYNPRANRTQYRYYKTSIYDFLYLGISAFIFSFIMFLWIYRFVFLPFGIIDAVLIL